MLTRYKASSIYQSDGLCRDQCEGSAFAVIQGQNCWCSDVEPGRSVQVSTTKCNTKCSGYPDDTCGGDGLWGYMMLGKDPSGTQGADKPSPTATKTQQVSYPSRSSLAAFYFSSSPFLLSLSLSLPGVMSSFYGVSSAGRCGVIVSSATSSIALCAFLATSTFWRISYLTV